MSGPAPDGDEVLDAATEDRGAVPTGIDPVTGVPYADGGRDRTISESVRASLALLTRRDR